jgi:hypothetical protein
MFAAQPPGTGIATTVTQLNLAADTTARIEEPKVIATATQTQGHASVGSGPSRDLRSFLHKPPPHRRRGRTNLDRVLNLGRSK